MEQKRSDIIGSSWLSLVSNLCLNPEATLLIRHLECLSLYILSSRKRTKNPWEHSYLDTVLKQCLKRFLPNLYNELQKTICYGFYYIFLNSVSQFMSFKRFFIQKRREKYTKVVPLDSFQMIIYLLVQAGAGKHIKAIGMKFQCMGRGC